LYEFDLMLKRLLNRREALNKRIWKKTIFALKIKLFRRRLMTMIKKIFWRS